MAIKALLKDEIIKLLEPVEKIEDGLIEIEIRKLTTSNESMVKKTKGSINLPKDVIREIAEREEILNENF